MFMLEVIEETIGRNLHNIETTLCETLTEQKRYN